ncbi:MAG: hypothetical protein QG614_99 [Patescibacteria group bacterium]|nr:hypothetical protein [Patescibacteria group bacterium]
MSSSFFGIPTFNFTHAILLFAALSFFFLARDQRVKLIKELEKPELVFCRLIGLNFCGDDKVYYIEVEIKIGDGGRNLIFPTKNLNIYSEGRFFSGNYLGTAEWYEIPGAVLVFDQVYRLHVLDCE